MPLEVVEKVIDGSRNYDLRLIDVGETGDAFMNPSAIGILRFLRANTSAPIRIFTNFQTFTPDKIDIVIEENLIDKVITNIDGASQETYRATKGLELKTIERHIDYFIEKKNKPQSRVYFRIQSLTLNHYVRTVRRVLGRRPLHVEEELLSIPDDFELIVEKWRAKGVTPVRSPVTLWAEKSSQPPPHLTLKQTLKKALRPKGCRLFPRISDSLFISPEGKVYLCCGDFGFELILGDVNRESIEGIVQGERRKDILDKLKAGRFSDIGGPCFYSDLCQLY